MVLLEYTYSFIPTLYLSFAYVVRCNTCLLDVFSSNLYFRTRCLHYECICVSSSHRELRVMI